MLGAVVGVVERRRHRVAVGRVGFAVRVGRHHRHELGDAGPERLVAGAGRVAHEHPLAADARRPVGPGVQHHADHRVAVGAELDVGVQLGQVGLVVDVQFELERPGRGEVVGADRRAVDADAELQPRDLGGRQDVAQREGLEDRTGHALAGDRHRLERLRQRRRRPQRDARVAIDDDRLAGALVQRVERQVHGPGAGTHRRPGRARLARRRAGEAAIQTIGVAVRLLDLQGGVVEQQRRLVARAAGGQVAAGEEPAGPGHQLLGQRVGLFAGLGRRCLGVGGGRRERLPGRDHVVARVAVSRPVDDVPHVIGEAAGDAFPGGQATDGGRRVAQCGPVLVVPGDVERLGVALEAEGPAALARDDAEALAGVERVDAVERRQLQAARARVGVEAERPGADDGVVGDLLGGLEVALDGGVLDRLDVAEVGESFAADRVARGVDAGLDVDAGQVVDGVGVLGAGQPADGDPARLAGVLRVELAERRADPGDRRGTFGVGREVVRVVRRRHVTALEHERDVVPDVRLLAHGGCGQTLGQLVEVDAALALGAGVAVGAGLLEDLLCGGSPGRDPGMGRERGQGCCA